MYPAFVDVWNIGQMQAVAAPQIPTAVASSGAPYPVWDTICMPIISIDPRMARLVKTMATGHAAALMEVAPIDCAFARSSYASAGVGLADVSSMVLPFAAAE
ncbi:UNVERIFIED_ORG: hypothetical protein ABIB52_003540 [Arthrobacter sp. UYCu721]